jgi:hypothetical protein
MLSVWQSAAAFDGQKLRESETSRAKTQAFRIEIYTPAASASKKENRLRNNHSARNPSRSSLLFPATSKFLHRSHPSSDRLLRHRARPLAPDETEEMDSFPADGGADGTRQQRRVLREDDDETAAAYLVCTYDDADDEDWRVVNHDNCAAAYGRHADEGRRMLINRDGRGVHSAAVYDQYCLASSAGKNINDRLKMWRARMDDVPVSYLLSVAFFLENQSGELCSVCPIPLLQAANTSCCIASFAFFVSVGNQFVISMFLGNQKQPINHISLRRTGLSQGA